ncbi:MAG TPA: protein kinase [Polyangiaceae bacterium]|nr:protein kinase [Polyangiaceae bacterium]
MMPREGTLIADRYRLERKVGGGRVSAVWRVRDEIGGRACAIKILHRSMHKHPEALTRFSLEDRLARELSGPHFPERVGSGVWDGLRYIAWRWHEGESLRALFERTPKQDAPTVNSIVQETCQALALLHAAGYAHGDLKPENIFFADRGAGERPRQVKLMGFGVASRLARPSAAGVGVGRRRPGEIVGTPLYLSPDLILGRVPNGGQADLWALAVIVYEALTGRAPFLGGDLGAVLQAILEKRAPRPSTIADNLPGSFDSWWGQALAQEFETPGELAGALARSLAPVLRSSHTQRSASLPERAAASLEVTPMPASPPAAIPSASASIQAAAAASIPAVSAPVVSAPAVSAPVVSAPVVAKASAPAAAPVPVPSVPLPRPNASTATGIGPAERVPPPRPPAPSDPALRVEAAQPRPAAGGDAARDPAPAAHFAPLPLPLRDLGGDVSRKTLVGITPPASEPGVQRPASRSAIEGAPCKPIETRADPSADHLRRPAHPTVPFPRPRVAPRSPAYTPAPDEPLDLGRTWQGTTTRTLRFVLTSRDHKPQRIAAALVCAAAALVIFVAGRSPVSGTANIGQATGSLSAEPAQRSVSGGLLADPARSELAVASGSEPGGEASRPDVVPPAEPPARPGVELAPGLVLPPPGVAARGPGDVERAATPGSGSASAATTGSGRAGEGAPGDAAAPGSAAPAPSSGAPAPTPPRAKPAPRKPPGPTPVSPSPPGKPSGDLDFGI